MKKLIILDVCLMMVLGLSRTAHLNVETNMAKAEDDFTVVKVADGVYAAIAKSGGLASGNAGPVHFKPAPVNSGTNAPEHETGFKASDVALFD